MKEIKITVTIKQDGEIESETKGIKGPSCVDELKRLFKDFDVNKSFEKTDEYYDSSVSAARKNTVSKGVK